MKKKISFDKKGLHFFFISVIHADVVADIAQLVEQLICNQWVGSSSLSVGTIKNQNAPLWCFFVFKEGLFLCNNVTDESLVLSLSLDFSILKYSLFSN